MSGIISVDSRIRHVFHATDSHTVRAHTSVVPNHGVPFNDGNVCHSSADDEVEFVAQ
jgi:hypothetical protein